MYYIWVLIPDGTPGEYVNVNINGVTTHMDEVDCDELFRDDLEQSEDYRGYELKTTEFMKDFLVQPQKYDDKQIAFSLEKTGFDKIDHASYEMLCHREIMPDRGDYEVYYQYDEFRNIMVGACLVVSLRKVKIN